MYPSVYERLKILSKFEVSIFVFGNILPKTSSHCEANFYEGDKKEFVLVGSEL